VRAGTYVTMGETTVLHSRAGSVSVQDFSGTISLWMAAADRRPASLVQGMTFAVVPAENGF
jgi:hypothetical protein